MPVLGELEQAVMEVLWESPTALPVRDEQAKLSSERELAYTTVMTVMDRLAKKSQLKRELDGRAWQYRPSLTWVQLVANEIVGILSNGTPEQAQQVLAAVRERVG